VDKIWLKSYQKGVPDEINLNQYESIVDLFETSCRKHKDEIAYVNMGTSLTYGQVDNLSQKLSSYLQQIGLEKGARVAIMMPNLLQYPVALFSILRAGFVVVNINPLYTSDELTHQLNDSGAEAIIVLANFARTVEKSMPKTPGLKHVVITQIGDLFPGFKRFIINGVVRYIKKLVPKYNLPTAACFNKAISQGKLLPPQKIKCHKDDIAFLQYTGGTTGVAKGAMLTHGNILANILQASAWISPSSVSKDDIIVTALPLYHIFSLTANCLTFFKIGAKNILITNPRDMQGFIKEIKNTKFTAITGVNTLFNSLLNHPDFNKINSYHLKFALAGGMALQENVALRWRNKTNTSLLEAYGLTETSPAITMNPMYLSEYNHSVGLPLPSTEISIRDEYGDELAVGEKGELCVKGPQVMSGYWQRQDETDHVFWSDGFLRTGDIAKMDNNGFIYLVDRIKDMIVVSGFNVYPTEVEQVLNMHAGILEAGVIGTKIDDSGERVKACIVKKDPDLTKEQIITYAREHLTAYKVPKVIDFYDDLPKSNVGKVLRRELR
jgi:long-chain acyl-CoA synthetase